MQYPHLDSHRDNKKVLYPHLDSHRDNKEHIPLNHLSDLDCSMCIRKHVTYKSTCPSCHIVRKHFVVLIINLFIFSLLSSHRIWQVTYVCNVIHERSFKWWTTRFFISNAFFNSALLFSWIEFQMLLNT